MVGQLGGVCHNPFPDCLQLTSQATTGASCSTEAAHLTHLPDVLAVKVMYLPREAQLCTRCLQHQSDFPCKLICTGKSLSKINVKIYRPAVKPAKPEILSVGFVAISFAGFMVRSREQQQQLDKAFQSNVYVPEISFMQSVNNCADQLAVFYQQTS